MSLAEAWENIETHVKSFAESAEARITGDLPEVAKAVQEVSSNPVTVALSAAVHLPEAPEVLASIADFITKADAALGAAKAAGATEAQQAAAAAPAEPVQPEAVSVTPSA